MADKFQYRPLKHGQFRLLRLHPPPSVQGMPVSTEDTTTIQCHITSFPLDDCPPYTALSYTWGLQDVGVPMKLNGCTTMIQQNLAAFLRHAIPDDSLPDVAAPPDTYDEPKRLSQIVGYIWIDALCIDQSSIQERNAQVAIMREIYTLASRIIIWLGPGNAESDAGMDVYLRLAKRDSRGIGAEPDRRLSDGEMAGLADLHDRDWWGRVWVWQEATSPNVPREFWCGAKRVRYEDVLYANNLLYDYWQTVGSVADLMYWNELLYRMGHLGLAREMGLFGQKLADVEPLAFSSRLRATDDRDRVFALLPLYQELSPGCADPPPPPPDYSLDARTVNHQAAAYLLGVQKNASILLLCAASLQPDGNTPSWAPPFFKPSAPRPASFLFEERMYYGADGGADLEIAVADDQNTIRICGARVDRIAATLAPLQDFGDSELMSSIARFAFPDGEDRPYVGGGSTFEALTRVLVQSKKYQAAEQPSSHYPYPWADIISGDYAPQLTVQHKSFRSLWSRSRQSVIYRTEKGYLGAGDQLAQIGDVVVLLFGLSLPMVLRPCPGNRWRIVGPSYVARIVDGELAGCAPPEEFVIC